MRKLYVCSKPLIEADGTCHRHLLGVLIQDENGRYQFRYALGNENSQRLLLSIFPDKDKIYYDRDARLLLDDYLPSENDTAFMKEILKKTGLREYDEWEWLKAFESTDENAETKLYETLPDDVIIHDKAYDSLHIDDLSIDVDDEEDNDFDEDLDENELSFDDFDEDENEDIPDILEHTDIPDILDSEIDDDFDELDDAFVFDNDNDNDTDENENHSEDISDHTIIIEPELPADTPDPEKPTTITLVTKTITRRVKKPINTNDFIAPPPDDPFELIQQRLKLNIEQRQSILSEKLKADTDTDSIL